MAERSYVRDLHYNLRHRIYGDLMTMIDIDNCEYDSGTNRPLALIETKFGLIESVNLNGSQFSVLCNLVEERLPVFLLVYYPFDAAGRLVEAESIVEIVHWQFLVCGANRAAERLLGHPGVRMTEKQWCGLLAKLHGTTYDEEPSGLSSSWKPCKLPKIIFRTTHNKL